MMAVGAKREIDRFALGRELGTAYITFRMLSADDHEPTRAAQRKQLEELHKRAARMLHTFQAFQQKGRPGWSVLRAAADEHLRRTHKQFLDVESRLLEAREEERRLDKRQLELTRMGEELPSSLQEEIRVTDTQLRALEQEREALSQTRIRYDQFRAEGILAHTMNGIETLRTWLQISLAWMDDPNRATSARSFLPVREEKGYVTAQRWLIGHALPETYGRYFGEPGFGRDRATGEPSGPMVRFVSTVLDTYGIVSAQTKRPFGKEGLAEYWRDLEPD
jgi:hypothetical protein